MMNRIKSPVLFDANILMNFKGQLEFLFSLFDNVLIHKQVMEEVLDETIKNEIDLIIKENEGVKIVEDSIIEGDVEKRLFEECDKELKNIFNIKDSKDLGEYKTLLYAKFNGIKLLSSQDTTVWRFVTESIYFNDIDCITIQDLAYLIYLNANKKKDRRLGKSLYNYFGRKEHSFDSFKRYMERNNNEIPKYIEFENIRIGNYNQLVEGYAEFYSKESFGSKEEIEEEIVNVARNNPATCLNCLYSRIHERNVDYNNRICSLNYNLSDDKCLEVREDFSENIRKRTVED
ncbi:hypothetical protein [Crassaminicella indica]|uniref:DUF4935 domain-containing protein n=1 Tax=Crassaminicella indica TaxID=2855394 RepID=A0ABX8RAA2_9CLOT|nr:hypothetical protein [Crassaminicella indica]QXM05726.1 hypothetical protein KVH43_10170 [Crassaminicella indica]